MDLPKPIIKFIGGRRIAICNRCFSMMCYVACQEDNDDNCIIIEKRILGDKEYVSIPIGSSPPPYCDECKELLTFSLNE